MDHQASQKMLGPFQEEVCLIFKLFVSSIILYSSIISSIILYSFGNIPFLYSWHMIVYLDFLLGFPFIMILFFYLFHHHKQARMLFHETTFCKGI